MIKPLALVLGLLSAAYAANETAYLKILLWDSMGDGWEDDTWWVVSDPAGRIRKDRSTCDPIEVTKYVRPAKSGGEGYYYMVVTTPDESIPRGWWEVYWMVEEFDKNDVATGLSAVGLYNSTMTWYYDQTADKFSLVHADNLYIDEECTGCTGGKCKPKPKAGADKNGKGDSKGDSKGNGKGDTKGNDKGPIKGKGGKGDDSKGSKGDGNSTAPEYGPRAVNLKVDMFSEDGDGWNNVNYVGAHWYISDYTDTKLFDDGALCEGYEGHCWICLGDGTYKFEVTGPTFNETLEEQWWALIGMNETNADGTVNSHALLNEFRFQSWEFCHARGSYGDQLTFHVKKGKCYPDELLWSDEICDGIEIESVVVLEGVIAVSGISSESFMESNVGLIAQTLAASVPGWESANLMVTATSLDSRVLENSRSLTSYTHDVSFTLSFVAESFGVDGTKFVAVENLADDMATTLAATLVSGVFLSNMASSPEFKNADLLQEVTSVELVSLVVAEITYNHNNLVYVYEEQNSADAVSSSDVFSNVSLSATMIVLFVAVSVIAFVAFVGVASHGLKGYNKLSARSDSEHVAAASATMTVRDFEMEEVNNPFANGTQSARSSFGKTMPRVKL